jgi:hypothetical protein
MSVDDCTDAGGVPSSDSSTCLFISLVYLLTLSQLHKSCTVEWDDDYGKGMEGSGRGLF